MQKTWLLKLDPVSSVSPTDLPTQGEVSVSEGSSKMPAICLALAMYFDPVLGGNYIHSRSGHYQDGQLVCTVGRIWLDGWVWCSSCMKFCYQ